MDLGATPVRVFFDIILPIIAPALISGWLLTFTLSLDDLVIASFVSGPGSSTLPMAIFSKVKLGAPPMSTRWPPSSLPLSRLVCWRPPSCNCGRGRNGRRSRQMQKISAPSPYVQPM